MTNVHVCIMVQFVFEEEEENIVGKGENAADQHFDFKSLLLRAVKTRDCLDKG